MAQGDIVESDTLLHFMCNILVLYTGTLTPPLLKLREPLRILEPGLKLFLAYLRIVSLPKPRFSAICLLFIGLQG